MQRINMELNSKIYVAGHRGLLGSAILRRLTAQGYNNILTIGREDLNLTNQSAVNQWFEENRPEYVFLTAAQVFGIGADVSGEVILNNLSIEINVIDAARRNGCKKLLFPGSNCVYPKFSKLPITEDQLLTGPLEPTSESYAAAKIAGIMMCRHFRKQWGFNAITVMPCNLYGPNDNFDLNHAHVMASLINKFDTAKEQNLPTVTLWGNGSALREHLFSDDAADACILCMNEYNDADLINLSGGEEITLKTLANKVKKATGYTGDIVWDTGKPTGTPAKGLDNTKIKNLGWKPQYPLDKGIPLTIKWYKENIR
jgi:GDP-L-fucose synthase